MKVQFVADSTYIFNHHGCRLLTDPWIGTAIYGGAWMQYPPPTMSARDTGPLDYIFISHIHEDHCDPKTIAELDRNAKIVLMDRQPNFVERFLTRHQFGFRDIIKVTPYTKCELAPGLSIEPLEADPAKPLTHMIDSSMMLHSDQGYSVYFGNDNSPYPDLLDYMSRYKLALALLPASGGAGYPACFESLSESEKAGEIQRIRKAYYDKFANAVHILAPERFMASAGYHVVAGRNHMLNHNMAFLPDPADAYSEVHKVLNDSQRAKIRPVQMTPGEVIDISTREDEAPDVSWARAMDPRSWKKDKAGFLQNVASKSAYQHDSVRVPHETDWAALFIAAAENLLEKSEQTNIGFASNIYCRLPESSGGGVGHIDGTARTCRVLPNDVARQTPYLEVGSDEAMLYQLLTGEFSWNIADAACFVRYKRDPNEFDQPTFIALNHLCSREYAPNGDSR